MRIFSSVFGIVLLVLVLSFALSNKQPVVVSLWPLGESIDTQLYAVGLIPLAFGFTVGALWGWLGALPHKLSARRLNKELTSLKGRIGDLQKNAAGQAEKPKSGFSFWRRP
jgi:hypothetical protein